MTITLNTGHALYPNLKALIVVDSDGTTIVDLKGAQTLAPHANVTRGAGAFGRHFKTNLVSGNSEGVAMSPGVVTMGTTTNKGCVFVAYNSIISRANRGSALNTAQVSAAMGPAIDASGHACITSNVTSATTAGTTNLVGTGAHTVCVIGEGNTNGRILVDGVLEASPTSGVGNPSNAAQTYIGGNSSGGFGGIEGQVAWMAIFDTAPTNAQAADLHANAASFGGLASETVTPIAGTVGWDDAQAAYSLTGTTGGPIVGTVGWDDAQAVYSITGTPGAPGRLVTRQFSNNSGPLSGLLANTAGKLNVYDATTGALLKQFSATTNAQGRFDITDGVFAVGASVSYEADFTTAGLGRRLPVGTIQ